MIRHALLSLVPALGLTQPTHAQRIALIGTQNDVQPYLAVVDAGPGMVGVDIVPLNALGSPPIQFIQRVDRVGPELWVSSNFGIERFDPATLAYLGRHAQGIGSYTRGFAYDGTRVVAARDLEFQEYALDGTLLATTPISFFARDIVWTGTEFYVLVGYSIRRYAQDLTPLGVFGTAPPTSFLDPTQIVLMTDGRVLLIGGAFIYEFSASGQFVAEHSVCAFENNAVQTSDGRILIDCKVGGLHIVEGDTLNESSQSYNYLPTTYDMTVIGPSSADQGRTCTGAVNSTGEGSQIAFLGDRSLGAAGFELHATHLPLGSFGIFVHGLSPASSPFGNGTLCISAQGGNLNRILPIVGPVASAGGAIESSVPAPGTLFAAGETHHFQLLYRDAGTGAGFNGSDAVFVTFVP
ncbi:MAG: hypothetical protein GY711_27845 [bacterium]|nr:hypothetical protein [bacterium]